MKINFKKTLNSKVLLWCGIAASLLYIATDIFLATRLTGYSYIDQTVSELSAIGASTKPCWTAMIFIFNPLLIAFGIGVQRIAEKWRNLRITGLLISIWGLFGFLWLLFPMNMRGAIGSTSDTMHLIMAGVTVPLMMLFIGFGSGAKGRRFRLYSILTILAMLVFGAWTGTQASRVAAQLPTPGLGIIERVSVYLPMIWIIVLASIFLQKIKRKP
jgi:hypothetical protein